MQGVQMTASEVVQNCIVALDAGRVDVCRRNLGQLYRVLLTAEEQLEVPAPEPPADDPPEDTDEVTTG